MTNLRQLAICTLSAALILPADQVRGALGEAGTSVESDRKTLSAATVKSTTAGKYTIKEIASTATTVREYVGPNGIVFGIAWNGLTHPDLPPLLGGYAGEYRSALQQTHPVRGSRRQKINSGRVVVEKWGVMRNLQGRAYAPDLLPAGVTIDEIR